MEPLRILVIGLPNVGKSSIINAIRAKSSKSGGGRALTGGQPGTTRGQASFQVWDKPPAALIDTPGVMLPQIEDNIVGLKFALLGTVKESIVPSPLLAAYLLSMLNSHNSHRYVDAIGLEAPTEDVGIALQAVMARFGVQNETMAAKRFVALFRSGHLGSFVLDEIDSHQTL